MVVEYFFTNSIEPMENQPTKIEEAFDAEKKLKKDGNFSDLPEGYFSLQFLSNKWGYAKDYIGWLSRTGRIEAIRYGKYGQWRASEDSLKNYIASLASASEQRYAALRQNRSTSKNSDLTAGLALSGTAVKKDEVVFSSSRNLEAPSVISFKNDDRSPSISSGIISETESQKLFSGTQSYKPEDIEEISKPVELSEPQNEIEESTTRPESSVLSPVLYDESSLSAEKKLVRRINTALLATVLLGGVLIFVYLVPFNLGASKGANKFFNKSLGSIKKPIGYVLNALNDLFDKPSFSTYISIYEGEENIYSSAARARDITITQDISKEKLVNIYDQLTSANIRIDGVLSKLSSLESQVAGIQPGGSSTVYLPSPVFQLPSTNTTGIGPVTLNPAHLKSETLNVTGASTLASLTVEGSFIVDTNTFVVDPTNNRVGIGTTSPEVAFEVIGVASISSNLNVGGTLSVGGAGIASASYFYAQRATAASPSFSFGVDQNTGFFSPGADLVAFSTGGAERLRIDNAGLVGIGTTSPTSKLTVIGNLETQGTASASYGLFGTLQVGGFSSVSYSRFGTATTGHSNYITTTNDVLVSGDLEVKGTASFAGVASISGVLAINNVRYTWPSSDGSNNNVLKTNGS